MTGVQTCALPIYIVDPEDVEMLEDLVMAAVNEGIRQIEEASSKAMEDITSGIEIPGMM